MLLTEGQKLVDAFVAKHFTKNQLTSSRFELLKYSVGQAKQPGLFLEFGVWKGDSLKYLASVKPNQRFYGFDCFTGLPEWWSDFYPKGHMMLDAPPYVPGDVILVEGLFQDTLEQFLEEHPEKVSFLHLDADLYSSTKYVLFTLADHDRLQPGTIIEFDEVFYQDSQHTLLDSEHRVYLEFMDTFDVDVRWLRYFQHRATTRASLIIECFNGRRM